MMMFPIRIWNIEDGRFENPDEFIFLPNGLMYRCEQRGTTFARIEIDEDLFIVEPSVSFPSKNGQIIFAGDIVQAPKTKAREFRREVIWKESWGCFAIYDRRKKQKYGLVAAFGQGNCPHLREFTVIGNVHENPELLERENRDSYNRFDDEHANWGNRG